MDIYLRLYMKQDTILVFCVDNDALLLLPHKLLIDCKLEPKRKEYRPMNEKELKDSPRTRFMCHTDSLIILTQFYLIDKILRMVHLDKCSGHIKIHDTLACHCLLLDQVLGLPANDYP